MDTGVHAASESLGGCPAQDLPLEPPFLLGLGRPRVLPRSRASSASLSCDAPEATADLWASRTQVRSVSGLTFRSAATALNLRLPSEARHHAIASDRNSALHFEGLAMWIYTFQDQQDPLSGASTPQRSPHSVLSAPVDRVGFSGWGGAGTVAIRANCCWVKQPIGFRLLPG